MLILAIETSGSQGSLAVCSGKTCLCSATLEGASRRHAQTLVSQIDEALRRGGLRATDLDAVAVSIGPGSFTGLRVGVVCAKTLAYATGCALAGVDTLEAIAANSPDDVATVHVVSDAQRGDLFVGTYRRSVDDAWSRKGFITIQPADSWIAGRQAPDAVSGPGLAKWLDRFPSGVRILSETAWTPDARVVAQIGIRQTERGQIADPFLLEPFYLRRSAAEERTG
jgi:tRNA threonylcarbamoyladenosine biosynthesis protein TsaB